MRRTEASAAFCGILAQVLHSQPMLACSGPAFRIPRNCTKPARQSAVTRPSQVKTMKHTLKAALLFSLALSACTSSRLSHDDARQKIAAIGRSSLVPQAIEIRRIVSQTDTRAIAESTV